MNDLLQKLLGLIRAILRFRWAALAFAIVVSTTSWAGIYLLEDRYVAEARVFVDSNRFLGPLLRNIAVREDVNERVTMMSRTLFNRPNMERLIRNAGLGEATSGIEAEQLMNEVVNRIDVTAARGKVSLYTLRYEDSDRDRAKRAVSEMISIFIDGALGDERGDSTTAQAFLDKQIAELSERLSVSERRLSDFKRANTGKMPGESGGYYSRLAQANSRSQETRLELEEARRREELMRGRAAEESPMLRSGAPVAPGAEPLSALARPLMAKLNATRDELDDLLLRFTEKHPRVTQLRASVKRLEAAIAAAADDPQPSPERYDLIVNPVYQEVRALLTDAEARVAELEVRARAYDAQVVELERTIESIPQVEAQLQQLTRDYDIIRGQYETLLQRGETARLSEQVEQNEDDVKFRVIDPPFVPARPTSPNKWLLSFAALIASLGLGCALALGLSLLRPVYYSAELLAQKTGRVELGNVQLFKRPAERVRDWIDGFFFLVLLMALGVVGALVVLIFKGTLSVQTLESLTGLPVGDWLARAGQQLESTFSGLRDVVGGLL